MINLLDMNKIIRADEEITFGTFGAFGASLISDGEAYERMPRTFGVLVFTFIRSPVQHGSLINVKTPDESRGHSFVRKRRFELPCQLRRYHLKVVRLPVSPPPQPET